MRVLIFWKRGAKLSRAFNERLREEEAALVSVRIDLLDRAYDQRTDRSPGFLCPIAQAGVEVVWKIDSGADGHA